MYRLSLSLFIGGALALAQSAAHTYTIPLTDPARPARVIIEAVNGGVTVSPNPGKDVVLEVTPCSDQGREGRSDSKGMHRVVFAGVGLEVTEKDNVVHIESPPTRGSGCHLKVLVPSASAVKSEVVQGDLRIEGVQGNVEAQAVNGNLILTDVAGTVVADSTNGRLTASLTRVAQDKPMSFTTVNGPIDLTLPADAKARMKLRTENGSVMSDFDLTLDPNQPTTSQQGRDSRGRYHLKIERSVYGTINGGGVEIRMESVNGSLYLHKR